MTQPHETPMEQLLWEQALDDGNYDLAAEIASKALSGADVTVHSI